MDAQLTQAAYAVILGDFLLAIGVWAGITWLKKRVEASAEGSVNVAVGKALAEHKLPLDRQLADHSAAIAKEIEALRQALSLDKERYSKDYALFAERRNALYAEAFRAFELARSEFYPLFAGSRPNFVEASARDMEHEIAALRIVTDTEKEALLAKLRGGAVIDSQVVLRDIVLRQMLREACENVAVFSEAWIPNRIYFSDDVDSLLDRAFAFLELIESCARSELNGTDRRNEAARYYNQLAPFGPMLRETMRREMQAGFAAPIDSATPPPNSAASPG